MSTDIQAPTIPTPTTTTTNATPSAPSLPPELAQPVDCLLIDNFDSFTWNLYQQLCLLGARVTVIRNDAIPAETLPQLDIKSLIISPGPGHPSTDSGISRDAVRYFTGRVPVLGVCMGLECIVDVYGGTIGYAGEIKHGKLSPIRHDGRGCFKDIPQSILSTRYHSLSATLRTLPKELMITCVTEESGVIMGVRHREHVVEAVQYHPESILSEGGDALLRNFLSFRGGTWSENPDALVHDNVLPPFPYDALIQKGGFVDSDELKNRVPTILERIYDQRLKDVKHAKSLPGCSSRDLDAHLALHLAPPLVSLVPRIKIRSPALMAEIKRASPSKGDIAPDANAAQQALTYALAGASVISVLTEPTWFKGSLLDMRLARQAVDALPNRPAILRKDFVLDEYQIAEARLWGADTILLIVAMLPPVRLRQLYAYSLSLGMEPLVEVHTPDEMRIALELGAKVIGVNNRNLHDFNVDMGTTSRLADMANGDVVLCALSGISGPEDVRRYVQDGVGAVLVGEALMRADDTRAFIHRLLDWPLPKEEEAEKEVLVKICGIASVEDAVVAAEAGADMLGLMFVPSSKRYISIEAARSIADAVHALRSWPNAPDADTNTKPETEAGTEAPETVEQEKEQVVAAEVNAPWFTFQARRLERTLSRRRPLLIGVFQNAPLHVVQDTVARVGLDLVQLHGSEPVEWARFVGVPVVRAFHVPADGNRDDGLRELTRPGLHSFVLLDAQRSDGLSGGSGKTIDWERARALADAGELALGCDKEADEHGIATAAEQPAQTKTKVPETVIVTVTGAETGTETRVDIDNGDEQEGEQGGDDADKAKDGVDVEEDAQAVERNTPRRRMPFILAGGLTPDNVAEAVARVRPWAVDVSGGVEREDGVGKDAEKVRAFVQAAKVPVAADAPVEVEGAEEK